MASLLVPGDRVRHRDLRVVREYVHERFLELFPKEDAVKKKLKESTVKAVGGFQHDKLVALLKEMGYEIEAAGVRVHIGQRVRLKHTSQWDLAGTQFTVRGADAFGALLLWRDNGIQCKQAAGETFETLDGKQVIGYED